MPKKISDHSKELILTYSNMLLTNIKPKCQDKFTRKWYDEAHAPINLQQLCDFKYRTKEKSSTTKANNIADDILNVISMVKDHQFIQIIEHSKNIYGPVHSELFRAKSFVWVRGSVRFGNINHIYQQFSF